MIRRTFTAMTAILLMTAYLETPMASAQTVPAQTSSALSSGATSVNETYNDWVVLCSATDKGRACLMTQQQRKKDTNQLVLAMELNSVSAEEVRGNLLLPFGLRLGDGVTLQINDGPVSKPLPFATCLPTGCIVQLAFDAATLKALKVSDTLKLIAKAHDGGQDVVFGVSLKGFSAAHDRVLALLKE
jgi:invasion protein IalB